MNGHGIITPGSGSGHHDPSVLDLSVFHDVLPDQAGTTTQPFLSSHIPQIAITVLLVVYSLIRAKLTPLGILAAGSTAVIHMLHPSAVPFYSLVVFFLSGTIATRINHAQKSRLTQTSTGGTGGEGARNASQVLANSGAASLIVLSSWLGFVSAETALIGVAANYAAAAADTFSSELGILSSSAPFLITRPWQSVPRGTNGGVTLAGLGAGLMGATIIAAGVLVSGRSLSQVAALVMFGFAGTVLDSVLGAVVQATVEDKGNGKVIEGENGRRVLVQAGGSRVQRGNDLLNNNGVNFAMTLTIAVFAMLALQMR